MTKHIIRAAHANGYVKCALVRTEAEIAATVAGMESAGFWLNIRVEPFTPWPNGRRPR